MPTSLYSTYAFSYFASVMMDLFELFELTIESKHLIFVHYTN
jgi:hypothetical protein